MDNFLGREKLPPPLPLSEWKTLVSWALAEIVKNYQKPQVMLPILTYCIYLLLQFLILYFTPRILGKLPLILQIYSLLPQHNKDFLTTILLNILTTAAHIAVNQTGGFSYPFITFTSTTNVVVEVQYVSPFWGTYKSEVILILEVIFLFESDCVLFCRTLPSRPGRE